MIQSSTNAPATEPGFRGPLWFCSNFYHARLVYEGIVFPTSEHAYQAAKTTSLVLRKYIGSLPSPAAAKREGRKIQVRNDWSAVKLDVMKTIVREKFVNPALAAKLLATGTDDLVETNHWHDVYWGRCVCKQHQGQGENHLGQILMQIRTELQGDPSAL